MLYNSNIIKRVVKCTMGANPSLQLIELSPQVCHLLAETFVLLLRVRALHVLSSGSGAHLLDLKKSNFGVQLLSES